MTSTKASFLRANKVESLVLIVISFFSVSYVLQASPIEPSPRKASVVTVSALQFFGNSALKAGQEMTTYFSYPTASSLTSIVVVDSVVSSTEFASDSVYSDATSSEVVSVLAAELSC